MDGEIQGDLSIKDTLINESKVLGVEQVKFKTVANTTRE